jgi:hypothetical protein
MIHNGPVNLQPTYTGCRRYVRVATGSGSDTAALLAPVPDPVE